MVLKRDILIGIDGQAEHVLTEHEGYIGVFTRAEAIGALPNATRVCKVNSERNDFVENGSKGKILGSIAVPIDMPTHPKFGDIPYFYFVEWDEYPKRAIGIVSAKLEKITAL